MMIWYCLSVIAFSLSLSLSLSVPLSLYTCSQYSVHHTRLRQSSSGYLECNVRAREQDIRTISNLGTDELRILYSPGFILGVPSVPPTTWLMLS